MGNYISAFITSFITMAVLDGIWLGAVAPAFYKKHIGYIMAEKPQWLAAGAFYIIFILGLTVFVIYPAWQDNLSIPKIALRGALFGLVTYATYDLTNQATIKNWPAIVTIVDLLWGTFITLAVSVVSVSILRSIVK